MILSDYQIPPMPSKLFAPALILSLFFSLGVSAQNGISTKADTLYIYQTEMVYDTVFVHDTVWVAGAKNVEPIAPIYPIPHGLNILQLDTLNNKANLLFISGNQGTFIPIDRIIFSEGVKNSANLNKLDFFGVMLFAFRNMVLAQADFGMMAGSGLWWAGCNVPSVGSHFSPMFSGGFYLKNPVSKQFFIESEFNYSFLLPNAGYKTAVDPLNRVIIGEGESVSTYHQFSIPFRIGFTTGPFEPSAGIEYSYRFSESWLNQKKNLLGISAGINYRFSQKLSLAVQYKYGLIKDYKANCSIINPSTNEKTGEYNYSWKSSSIGVSLHYSLKKKDKPNT